MQNSRWLVLSDNDIQIHIQIALSNMQHVQCVCEPVCDSVEEEMEEFSCCGDWRTPRIARLCIAAQILKAISYPGRTGGVGWVCVCWTAGEKTLPVQAVQVDPGLAHRGQAHAEPGPPALLLCERDSFYLRRQPFNEEWLIPFVSLTWLRTLAEEMAPLQPDGKACLLLRQQLAASQHFALGPGHGGHSRPSEHWATGLFYSRF